MPIVNPYAKKRKPGIATDASKPTSTTAAQTDNTSIKAQKHIMKQPTNNTASSALAATSSFRRSSFSQSFAPIEDEAAFERSLASASGGNLGAVQVDSEKIKERALQRSMDQQQGQNQPTEGTSGLSSAAGAEASAPAGPYDLLSDRDHHMTLQQSHVLYVSTKQRGNGVLQNIMNVPIQYTRMVPDYILSTTRCALFLSIKYHQRFPQYISRRISELKTDFDLRLLLVLVDVEDNAKVLLDLNKLAVINNMTLVLSWSEAEVARYLETYKAFDGKDASLIQKREQTNFLDQITDFLTTIKSVNRTDAAQLISQFRTMRSLLMAPAEDLALVPGMGEVKVKRLHDAFHKPFSTRAAKKRKKEKEMAASTAIEATTEAGAKDLDCDNKGDGGKGASNGKMDKEDIDVKSDDH